MILLQKPTVSQSTNQEMLFKPHPPILPSSDHPLVKSTDYETSHHVVSFSLLSKPLSYKQTHSVLKHPQLC
jgi:hypothetical protein